MSVDNINKKHVLAAVAKIEKEGIELKPSTRYDVIINNKAYPPKEVMRYANFMANEKNEWTISGGEPTNKFLREYGFEIVSKNEEGDPTHTVENFIAFLNNIGLENATAFFRNATDLIRALKISQNDSRLTFGTRRNKRLAITMGQRYCFAFIPNEDKPWQFIHSSRMPSTKEVEVSKYEGEPKAYYYRCLRPDAFITYFEGISRACQNQLLHSELSGYRKFNNAVFEKAIFEDDYRTQLFQAAFVNSSSTTGTIWKLGCNWGSRKPSFYDLIKDHSIVIGVNDKLYSNGDLIVITEGYTVKALVKVSETPKPVTTSPDFEEEFAKYEIDYGPGVNYARAEWYELAKEEVFTYQLQQGICKVNDPLVRNKVNTLWNDRHINYWVFQCNPNDFDFETAIKNNLLNSWTVTAHKDKIKTGDKVILWLTGKRSGCYALARVTSDPGAPLVSQDNHLWKTDPKSSLHAGIEITHNLLTNPILSENIRENEVLKELKAGHQGTNFSATRQQYNTLLKLIDKSTIPMNSKIDLYLNTILYGPPGTGKTYRMNEIKEEYFTDRGITKSSEEILREKAAAYPFWKIFAAVLNGMREAVSVSDILAHPLVKAKINTAAKTPQNTVWRILQSYADQESTQMNEKYRGPLELFHKDQDSKWSIIDSKRGEIYNIIDQELIDLALSPNPLPIKDFEALRRYNFITFHQKYSYEDFIEGIKPLLREDTIEEAAGDLQFELKKGIFYNSCLKALNLVGYKSFEECYSDSFENRVAKFNASAEIQTKQFALFIDEINRANISAVFGELITLLEDDKRMGANNEMWIELPYSNEKFCVPANLYVIGTMNTADRSIALLDIALRRRFEFKALYPLYTETEWWASLLEGMNKAIYKWKKNPDFFIGHAFFINKPESERTKILNRKIIPLLYEYCQNNAETVLRILSESGIKVKETDIKENFQIIAE